MTNAALKALLLPFADGTLVLAGEERTLFLNAEQDEGLEMFPSLDCEQSWKGTADALVSSGYRLFDGGEKPPANSYDLVLLILGKSRDAACYDLARAFSAVRPGGLVVCAAENANGAGRLQTFFEKLAGNAGGLSKHKCRVFWAKKEQTRLDHSLLTEWAEYGDLRPVAEGAFVSRPGLFSWDRIDPGSRFLIETLQAQRASLKGKGADFGCGAGYLSGQLLGMYEAITIDAIDGDRRALEAVRANLGNFIEKDRLSLLWHDISQGFEGRRYAWIISNPPFHEGRETRASLGGSFIASASAALTPTGTFWMVANRHLPYEKTLDAHFSDWECLAESDGFKIVRGRRPKGGKHGRS